MNPIPPSRDKRKILIIEDDVPLGNLLLETLERYGFEARLAEDSLQGLLQASKFRPDAIILDFNLPAGDGLTLLRRIRKHEELRDIPVILYSAMPEDFIRAQVSVQPNLSFLSKSQSFSTVVLRLYQVLDASPVR